MSESVTVTILGSGTIVPSLARSTCSFLLEAAGQKLLFDIGPGTMRRLLEAGITIGEIDVLLLSHLHPDHSGELVSFLFAAKYPEAYPQAPPLHPGRRPGPAEVLRRAHRRVWKLDRTSRRPLLPEGAGQPEAGCPRGRVDGRSVTAGGAHRKQHRLSRRGAGRHLGGLFGRHGSLRRPGEACPGCGSLYLRVLGAGRNESDRTSDPLRGGRSGGKGGREASGPHPLLPRVRQRRHRGPVPQDLAGTADAGRGPDGHQLPDG